MRPSIVRTAALALLVLLAAACTKSSSDAGASNIATSPGTTVTGSVPGSSSGSPASGGGSGSSSGTPTPTASPTSSSGTPPPQACTGSDVTALSGIFKSGATNASGTFVITNAAPGPCWIDGYPGLRMLDDAGNPMKTRVAHGKSTGVPDVPLKRFLLRPGKSATTYWGYSSVPSGSEHCPTSSKVLITMPGTNTTAALIFHMAPCGGRVTASAFKPGAVLS